MLIMNGIAVLSGVPAQYEAGHGRAYGGRPGRRRGVGDGGGREVLGLDCIIKNINLFNMHCNAILKGIKYILKLFSTKSSKKSAKK